MRETTGRVIPQLDGVRAIAVILVMLFHTTSGAFAGGWVGVDIFFVLSGYLITGILVREFELTSDIDFRNFYIRRALRLFPALAVFLAFYGAITLPFSPDTARHTWAIVAAGTYTMDWVRAFGIDAEGRIGHTWSLAVEEQFYLFWPIILLVCLRTGGRRSAGIAAVALLLSSATWRAALSLSGASYLRTYAGFDTRADALFLGCFLAIYELPVGARRISEKLIFVPIVFLAAVAIFAPITARWLPIGGFTFIAFASGWIILACQSRGGFLLWPRVQFLGRISYGFYLWHALFSNVLTAHSVPMAAVVLLVPPLTLLAAMASYFWIERPFLALKGSFAPRTLAVE